MNGIEFKPFYDENRKRILFFTEYILKLEEEKNQLIFDIKEATGTGNYKDVDLWSYDEIIDYTKRKSKQIEIQKRNLNTKKHAK